jgi:hypothetical protein
MPRPLKEDGLESDSIICEKWIMGSRAEFLKGGLLFSFRKNFQVIPFLNDHQKRWNVKTPRRPSGAGTWITHQSEQDTEKMQNRHTFKTFQPNS